MEINSTVIDIAVDVTQPIVDVQIVSPINVELNTNPIPLKGDKGLSAYELATQNGFTGTIEEWLLSLKVDSIEWSSTNW